MKEEYRREEKEIKKDCRFYFEDETGIDRCNALNDVYCKKERCRFYKQKNKIPHSQDNNM